MTEGSDLVVPATVDPVALQPSASDHESLGDKHVDDLVEGLLLGYTSGGANLKSGESQEESLKDLMQALQEMDGFVREYSGRK
jgi:hypothetical protein